MIALAAATLTAASAPALATVQHMTPKEAGEAVLRGKPHGEVQRIEVPQTRYIGAPGVTELFLIEKAVPQSRGCIGRRWHTSFAAMPLTNTPEPTLYQTFPTREAALKRAAGCPDDGYTTISHEIDDAAAIMALRRLNTVIASPRRHRFACTDTTRANICASNTRMMAAIKASAPDMLSRGGSGMAYIIPAGVCVVEVVIDNDRRAPVTVRGFIPPPF